MPTRDRGSVAHTPSPHHAACPALGPSAKRETFSHRSGGWDRSSTADVRSRVSLLERGFAACKEGRRGPQRSLWGVIRRGCGQRWHNLCEVSLRSHQQTLHPSLSRGAAPRCSPLLPGRVCDTVLCPRVPLSKGLSEQCRKSPWGANSAQVR